ncbi:MAG: SusC/RagA family TonB-linked outer membrane protein [Odoribacteraceae bacterium]|nr:SusC/RagA family TonB-linked outer membrane protein [Odoribacteraceae bacterium]
MRLTGLLCLLGLVPISATTYSQEYSISLNMENATVQEVFDEITRATGLDFFYNNALFNTTRRVDVAVAEASIEETLKAVFKGYRVRFTVNDHFIVLLDLRPDVPQERPGKLVSGTVKDASGEPLPGVTIRVKGTGIGIASEPNGHFALPVPLGDVVVLQFSFIGMKAKEITWTGETVINVVMEEEAREIDEVVVLGIASVNRRDMVGSFTQLPIDAVMQPAYSSVDQMLEGRIAGMTVTTTSLRAGSAPSVTIRGRSTLLGNTQPLWVVDGIVQGEVMEVNAMSGMWGSSSDNDLAQYLGSQISWLNPNDIETITVLKDATATAIYGSRASNGVIVITTKKGSSERLSINASANWNVRVRPTYKDYSLMNSQERIKFSRDAFEAGAFYQRIPLAQPHTYEGLTRLLGEGLISEQEFAAQYERLETVNTDWLDLLARHAVGQRYNISINGGTTRSTYSFSASYDRSEGVERGNDSERITTRLASNMTLSPRVRLDIAITGGLTTTTGFAANVNPLAYAITTSRAIPAYNPDGSRLFYKVADSYAYNANTVATGLDFNILNERDNSGSRFTAPSVNANVNFKWEITPFLAYELAAGTRLESRKGEIWADAPTEYVAREYRGYSVGSVEPGGAYYKAALLPFGGELQTEDSFGRGYEVRNTLKFNHTFGDDHRLVAQASWEVRSNYRNSKVNTVWGFDRDRGEHLSPLTNLSELVPIGASVPRNFGVFDNLYRGRWRSTNFTNNYASAIFIGSYTFKDRYIVNANARNDWSNRFGQNINRRFDPTYSLGVAWRAADESFLENNWLSQLTPRVSYGIQGNVLNSISPDMILQKGNASTLYNDYLSSITQLANPFLSWERTKIWNFGVDLGLFDNRLSLVVDGYSRISNVGTFLELSPEYGPFSTPITGTEIRNSGVEATLNVVALRRQDWQLSIGANVARNRNKVLRVDHLDTTPRTTANYLSGQESRILETGYGYGAFWAYSFAGLDENTGYPTFNNLDMEAGTPYTEFLVHAGTRVPVINGGANFRLGYKNVALQAVFSASLGGKDFLPNPYESFYAGLIPSPANNLPAELARRWKKSGDVAEIPGIYTGGDLYLADPSENGTNTRDRYEMWARSDARVASTSTVKCKMMQLTWNSRAAFLQEIGVTNLSLNASVNNLFMLVDKKWDGKDPALGGKYVEPRSFNVGINIGF